MSVEPEPQGALGPMTAANSSPPEFSKQEQDLIRTVKKKIKHHVQALGIRGDQTTENDMAMIVFTLLAKKTLPELLELGADLACEEDEQKEAKQEKVEAQTPRTYRDNLQEQFDARKLAQENVNVEDRVSDEMIVLDLKPGLAKKMAAKVFDKSPHKIGLANACQVIVHEEGITIKAQANPVKRVTKTGNFL